MIRQYSIQCQQKDRDPDLLTLAMPIGEAVSVVEAIVVKGSIGNEIGGIGY